MEGQQLNSVAVDTVEKLVAGQVEFQPIKVPQVQILEIQFMGFAAILAMLREEGQAVVEGDPVIIDYHYFGFV